MGKNRSLLPKNPHVGYFLIYITTYFGSFKVVYSNPPTLVLFFFFTPFSPTILRHGGAGPFPNIELALAHHWSGGKLVVGMLGITGCRVPASLGWRKTRLGATRITRVGENLVVGVLSITDCRVPASPGWRKNWL